MRDGPESRGFEGPQTMRLLMNNDIIVCLALINFLIGILAFSTAFYYGIGVRKQSSLGRYEGATTRNMEIYE
jgi:hypothetical protein